MSSMQYSTHDAYGGVNVAFAGRQFEPGPRLPLWQLPPRSPRTGPASYCTPAAAAIGGTGYLLNENDQHQLIISPKILLLF